MELDKVGNTLFIDQAESVHPKSLHHAVASRDCPVRHSPVVHVRGLGVHILKVPEIVVGGLCLRDLIMRFWFSGMDCIVSING